jgi:hypothetical protein
MQSRRYDPSDFFRYTDPSAANFTTQCRSDDRQIAEAFEDVGAHAFAEVLWGLMSERLSSRMARRWALARALDAATNRARLRLSRVRSRAAR